MTMCPRGGGGGGVTCPGGQGIFDPQWGGLIKALTCPGGRGALKPCVYWGWRGLKKNMPPARIISGTALTPIGNTLKPIFFIVICIQ